MIVGLLADPASGDWHSSRRSRNVSFEMSRYELGNSGIYGRFEWPDVDGMRYRFEVERWQIDRNPTSLIFDL